MKTIHPPRNRLDSELEKALALMDKGRHTHALKILATLNKLQPQNYLVAINLGVTQLALGQDEAGQRTLHTLYLSHPEDVKLLKLCARAYYKSNQFDISIKFLKRALNIDPLDYDSWQDLAHAAAADLKDIEALSYSMKALELRPADPNAHCNLGAALLAVNRASEARYCFETALTLSPNHPAALSNLATLENLQGNYQEAVEVYEKCLKIEPQTDQQRTDLRFKMSFPLLALGRIPEGWRHYEHGFGPKTKMARTPNRQFSKPRWDGKPSRDSTLLVWREQGIGDELRYACAINEASECVGKTIIECTDRFLTLFRRSFPNCEVRTQRYDTRTMKSPKEDFDMHIPMASLMPIFRNSIQDFAGKGPHLKPCPNRVAEFVERLSRNKKPLIGISWRSGHLSASRNLNYSSLAEWSPILKNENFQFVNLQYGDCEGELLGVEQDLGVGITRWPDLDLKNDLDGVAALTAALDFVVTAPTAVAEMTGAVGKKMLMFGVGGYYNLGTENYPFYPSCRFLKVSEDTPLSSSMNFIADILTAELL